MSSPERLIDELRGDASEVAPGEFTLDREQARSKLRQFQLADPRRYVLFLVEAAILRGATRVDFRIDSDDVVCEFDGPPLTAYDFDELYGSLFVRSEDDATRARRALALGLNAAMALNPRWIRVDSGDEEAAVRFELRADRPDAIQPAPEAVAGTRVHVKSRFRAGLAVAFVRNLAGSVAEERWLRWHCRFSRVPVLLDGKPVSFGFDEPWLAEAAGRAPIEEPGLAGMACFDPARDEPPRVGLLCSGVLVAWHRPDGPPHAFGVVESRDFRRDASQSDVVRDAAWERALAAWRRAADAALAGALERGSFGGSAVVAGRVREAVLDALRRRREAFTACRDTGAALDPIHRALARVPVWNAVRGEPLHTEQLLAEIAAGRPVRYTAAAFDDLPDEAGQGVVRTAWKDEADLLQALFAGRTEDVTPALQRAVEREKARRRFLERQTEARLPPRAGQRIVEPVRGEGVEGEVAVGGSQGGALIRFVREGCLLVEKRVDLPFAAPPHVLPVEAVLSAAFAPNESWDGVEPDGTLVRAVVALLEALHRAMQRLCEQDRPAARTLGDPRRHSVLSWLRGALDPDHLRNTLVAFGAAPDRIAHLVSETAVVAPEVHLGVGRMMSGGAGKPLHPAARVPLFERLAGPAVDLAMIDAEVRERGRVSFLSAPPLAGGWPQELLLLPSPAELEVLRRVFGAEALHDATPEWRVRERRAAFERQLPEPPGPDPRGFESVPVRADGLEGHLCVLSAPPVAEDAASAGALRPMKLRILRQGRFLGERKVWMVAGPLAATVDGHDVQANAEWTDVEDPAFEARACAATAAALVPLVERLAVVRSRLPFDRRQIADRLLLEAACAPFPEPGFADVWATLRAAVSFDAARDVLLRLSSWVGRVPGEDLVTALEIALEANIGDSSPPAVLPERVALCLGRDDRPASEAAPVPAQAAWLAACEDDPVWPMPQVLRETPLFRSLGDAPVTPGQIAARLGAGETIGWVAPDVPVEADGERLVVRLGPAEQTLLARALGPRRLVDCNEETRRRQRLRRLESVPRLERVALAAGEALLVEPVAAGRVTGEVGLAAEPEAGPSVLTICSDRRPLVRVEGFSPHALRAVVNDDDLALEAGTTNPSPGEPERLARLVESLVPRLIETLAGRWPALSGEQRGAAWRHLLDALASSLPHVEGRSLEGARAWVRAAAAVPGFRTWDGGRRSLVELRASAARLGGVFVVSRGAAGDAPPAGGDSASSDGSFVLVVESWEGERLRRLFPKVVEWPACSEEERQAIRCRAALPPLPDHGPVAKLAKLKFDRGGVRGRLFLPRDPAVPLEVSFGCNGLEVGRSSLAPLPCAGIAEVPEETLESTLRHGWSVERLDAESRAALEWAAVQTYRMLLAGRFDQADANEDRVRDLLADAALRLQWAAVEAGGRLQGEAGVLLRDLKVIPLVRRGKKRVRLDSLLRRRPPDLEPLGLWVRREEAASGERVGDDGDEGAQVPSPEASGPAEGVESNERAGSGVEGGGVAMSAGVAAVAEAGGMAAAPGARPAAPVVEPPEERERRFLGRLAMELQRVWPTQDRAKVRVGSLVMVEDANGLPGRYGPDVVSIGRRHPLVRGALDRFDEDPVPLWILVSFLATQANLEFTRITDEHERAMQAALVERLAEWSSSGR